MCIRDRDVSHLSSRDLIMYLYLLMKRIRYTDASTARRNIAADNPSFIYLYQMWEDVYKRQIKDTAGEFPALFCKI